MPVLKNARHEAFAQALAKGKSADEAYAQAGYKPHRGNASTLRAKQNIVDRVAELQQKGADKASISVARVLQEMSRLGLADIRNGFDADGNLLPPQEWSDDFAASVASIEVVTRTLPSSAEEATKEGGRKVRRRKAKVEYVHKIRFWDKNSALEKIAKHLGMFVDRIEHSGPSGGPIQTETRTWREVLRDKRKD